MGDVEKVIALQGISNHDAKAIRKGAEQVLQKGRDYRLGSDGSFNAFTPEARTGSSRAGGNKKGFNAGDLVGMGDHVSKFMGLVNRFKDNYHKHNEEVASGKKEMFTGDNTALKNQLLAAEGKKNTPVTTTPTTTVAATGGGNKRMPHSRPAHTLGDLANPGSKSKPSEKKKPMYEDPEQEEPRFLSSIGHNIADFFDPRTADPGQFGGLGSLDRWRETPDRLLAIGETSATAGAFGKGARGVFNKVLLPAQLAGVGIRSGIDASRGKFNGGETMDYLSNIGMQAVGANVTPKIGRGVANKVKPLVNKIPGVKNAGNTITSLKNKLTPADLMKRGANKINIKTQVLPETNPARMLNAKNPVPAKQLGTWGEKATTPEKGKFLQTWGEPAKLKTEWSGAEVKAGSQNIKFKGTNPASKTIKKKAKQMAEEGALAFKSGGKMSAAELVRLSPYKNGGGLPKAETGKKLLNYNADGSEVYDDGNSGVAFSMPHPPTLGKTQDTLSTIIGGGQTQEEPVASADGKFSNQSKNPKGTPEDPANGDSKFGAIAGKAAKYSLPFIGEALARQELNKFKPPVYSPAQLAMGTVYDMPRPDMGLRYRQPTGPDIQTENAKLWAADAQARDKNYAFQTQNAASRIEQKQHQTDRFNQGEMMNAQGRNMSNIYGSQMLAQLAGAKYQSVREPFIAAQQHLGTDISTGAFLDADTKTQGAMEIIRNPDTKPEIRRAAEKYLLGKGFPTTPTARKGMKFTAKHLAHA